MLAGDIERGRRHPVTGNAPENNSSPGPGKLWIGAVPKTKLSANFDWRNTLILPAVLTGEVAHVIAFCLTVFVPTMDGPSEYAHDVYHSLCGSRHHESSVRLLRGLLGVVDILKPPSSPSASSSDIQGEEHQANVKVARSPTICPKG